jgi:hypothetical protein
MFDFEVSIVAFGQDIAQKQRLGLISTLDLEAPFFEIIESRFEVFKDVLRHSKAVKFLWLLPPSQVGCKDSSAAKSLGMLRIARAELAIPITTLEINSDKTNLPTLVKEVFTRLWPSGDFHLGMVLRVSFELLQICSPQYS